MTEDNSIPKEKPIKDQHGQIYKPDAHSHHNYSDSVCSCSRSQNTHLAYLMRAGQSGPCAALRMKCLDLISSFACDSVHCTPC